MGPVRPTGPATGGVLVLFGSQIGPDGSLKRPPRSLAAERPLQVSYWMGVGWALGLAPHGSEHRLTGGDPGPVEWIHSEGRSLVEDQLVTASSFFSEAAALAIALRHLMSALVGMDRKWGTIVHLADNEGLTQVLNKWDRASRQSWRLKAGQTWRTEIRGRVRHVVTRSASPWVSYWIRGHSERRKEVKSFHDIDVGSQIANTAAGKDTQIADPVVSEPEDDLTLLTRLVAPCTGSRLEEGSNRAIRIRAVQQHSNRYLQHRQHDVLSVQDAYPWGWISMARHRTMSPPRPASRQGTDLADIRRLHFGKGDHGPPTLASGVDVDLR